MAFFLDCAETDQNFLQVRNLSVRHQSQRFSQSSIDRHPCHTQIASDGRFRLPCCISMLDLGIVNRLFPPLVNLPRLRGLDPRVLSVADEAQFHLGHHAQNRHHQPAEIAGRRNFRLKDTQRSAFWSRS